ISSRLCKSGDGSCRREKGGCEEEEEEHEEGGHAVARQAGPAGATSVKHEQACGREEAEDHEGDQEVGRRADAGGGVADSDGDLHVLSWRRRRWRRAASIRTRSVFASDTNTRPGEPLALRKLFTCVIDTST